MKQISFGNIRQAILVIAAIVTVLMPVMAWPLLIELDGVVFPVIMSYPDISGEMDYL